MNKIRTAAEIIPFVAETVCKNYNLTVKNVRFQRRNSKHIYPRQLIMYLSIHLAGATFEEVAEYMGISSINTVKYADQCVSERISSCENARSEIKSLNGEIQKSIIGTGNKDIYTGYM